MPGARPHTVVAILTAIRGQYTPLLLVGPPARRLHGHGTHHHAVASQAPQMQHIRAIVMVRACGLAAGATVDGGIFRVFVDVIGSVVARQGPAARALWLVGLALPSYSNGVWTALESMIRIVLPTLLTGILGDVPLVVLRGHSGGTVACLGAAGRWERSRMRSCASTRVRACASSASPTKTTSRSSVG